MCHELAVPFEQNVHNKVAKKRPEEQGQADHAAFFAALRLGVPLKAVSVQTSVLSGSLLFNSGLVCLHGSG
jgi:hypothetical protein